jgi:L-fuculose-phosphate aldolase
MSFSLLHPRDQIVTTMERIYAHDMTTTSGGNISVRDENGGIWITPARVDKGALRPRDIVQISPDGTRHGVHPPSSEWPFHLGIYKARPDLRAVIHAHPGALVSFSICGRVPDTRVFPEAWRVCGKVGFAPYALPGSSQLGENIAAQFASPEQPQCVVLENHGVVVAAQDLAAAFQRFETLEVTAQTIINASSLGEVHYMDESMQALPPASRPLLPEHEPAPPSIRERELRTEICEFVHRACAHRLMTSTKGSFSARIDDSTIVMTPYQMDRQTLSIVDLVVVRSNTRAKGQIPSRAVALHTAIYNAHPEINAVVNALPVHSTAFCVSDFQLDTRTIPESYLFLKDVRKIPFQMQYGDCSGIAEIVTPSHPVALLQNNGVLVAGRTVLDAFDRLEVLDSTAAAILRSRALGAIHPMPEKVISELLAAFPNV